MLFSRGCGYDYDIPDNKIVIGIGCCHRLKTKSRIYLTNPCDRTCNKDMSQTSLKCHWTLTSDMIKKIDSILSKFNDISEVSTMGAITPYQKLEKPVYRTQFPK